MIISMAMLKPIRIQGGRMVSALTIFYAHFRQEDDKPRNKIRLHVYKTIALRRECYFPVILTPSWRGGSVYKSMGDEGPQSTALRKCILFLTNK